MIPKRGGRRVGSATCGLAERCDLAWFGTLDEYERSSDLESDRRVANGTVETKSGPAEVSSGEQ